MIRDITAKALRQNIVQNKPSNLTLSEGWAFKIDKEFFEAFIERNVPYIHLRTTLDFSKHIAIDPKNKSFIKYFEDLESDYKWRVHYDKTSSSCKLVSVDKQNPDLNAFACFNPFKFDCIINDKLEVLPLGSVNTE